MGSDIFFNRLFQCCKIGSRCLGYRVPLPSLRLSLRDRGAALHRRLDVPLLCAAKVAKLGLIRYLVAAIAAKHILYSPFLFRINTGSANPSHSVSYAAFPDLSGVMSVYFVFFLFIHVRIPRTKFLEELHTLHNYTARSG